MAAALFESKLPARAQRRDWRVESAGTWALDGQPASPYARRVMAARGLELQEHRARRVDAGLLAEFDLILAMEAGQKEALQVEFPPLAGRIFLLGEMAGRPWDVEDPMGSSPAVFEATARDLDELLDRGFEKILQLADPPEVSSS